MKRAITSLAVCGLLLSACSVTTIKSSGDKTSSSSTPAKASARVGSSITLKGNDSGEKAKITVVKIVDPARSDSPYTAPAKGNRYIAVRLTIQNVGTTVYDDSPSNGSKLIDTAAQQYDADIGDAVTPGFGSVKMSPGATRAGYITFEVPKSVKAATFQFALDSGFGPETGEWKLG